MEMVPPVTLIRHQFVDPCAACNVVHILDDPEKIFSAGIADYGHNQVDIGQCYGHADINAFMQDDLCSVNGDVNHRKIPYGLGNGFNKDRGEG